MYVPKHFRVEDPFELAAFMNANAFAALVTMHDGAPFASHIPFLVDGQGPGLTLAAHVARANPQWRTIAGQEVLVAFTGPHAYVSPRWYAAMDDVPTWNYMAVHVYGTARIIEDREGTYEIVRRLTDRHEAQAPVPWRLQTLASEAVETMLRAIVAFTITPTRVEGKYKLSQNTAFENRLGVIAALEESPFELERGVAASMRAGLPEKR
jgi:transcriptional regulator